MKTITERNTSSRSFTMPARVSIRAEVFEISSTTATFSRNATKPLSSRTGPKSEEKMRSYGSSAASKMRVATKIKTKHRGAV